MVLACGYLIGLLSVNSLPPFSERRVMQGAPTSRRQTFRNPKDHTYSSWCYTPPGDDAPATTTDFVQCHRLFYHPMFLVFHELTRRHLYIGLIEDSCGVGQKGCSGRQEGVKNRGSPLAVPERERERRDLMEKEKSNATQDNPIFVRKVCRNRDRGVNKATSP